MTQSRFKKIDILSVMYLESAITIEPKYHVDRYAPNDQYVCPVVTCPVTKL
jgi:hypothetical protein